MRLTDATWTDADAADVDAVLLPVGSTEQHGPHAPLGTDAIAAETVAERAADAYDDANAGSLLVAPTVSVGVSEEHRQFTGTLWVAPDTFRAYVRDTVASLAHHGWTDVVLVNGHGGNVPALGEVAATITRHDDAYAVPFTWFDAVGEHSADMGHAGPLETAFLRHTDPDLVREDRVDAARDGASERWGEWVSHANLAHDAAEFSENGVVGDPGDGSAERGAELLSLAVESLCDLVAAVVARENDRPPHK
ncbi:creatininase family protein [Halarchaeum sp. CBA1220]|uniref:creatininase family protein n=1 Tax=Halarchaeum sp. CBA1220 TaxID=1853682 RepID=UPI000F3A8185|nr:creatininase family protein [Halarchaeum sp. CBA1220]QLC33620.1 creatininase family protein [Halarchaeum sp. CBA1220]